MEGTGGTTTAFTFSVTLDNAVQGGFGIAYTTDDSTATVADLDYVDNDGTLNFVGSAGEVQTITVLVNHDSKVEADETFTVALGLISGLGVGIDPTDVTVAGSPQTGTIQNDDTATVTLASVNASQVEGTGGTTTAFTFSVTLDNPVQGGFDLAYTTNDGTATVADNDYVDNDGGLTFLGTAGETQTITVLVNHDAKVEADELFTVALGVFSNLGAGVDVMDLTPAGSPQTGTIQNDDAATISISSPSIAEGGGLIFEVTIDNPVDVDILADRQTQDVTATTLDNDYTGRNSQTVTLFMRAPRPCSLSPWTPRRITRWKPTKCCLSCSRI